MGAAEDLFAERGFDAVSVTEIADRADVGRTTFFRHFGDKQAVVFAQEEELIDTIAAAHAQTGSPVPSTLQEAIRQLREVVLALCAQATHDPNSYRRHYGLINDHPELKARDALKMKQFADRLAAILNTRGADKEVAQLAAQLALGCYQAAKLRHDHDPRTLIADTRNAFEQLLNLGCPPRRD